MDYTFYLVIINIFEIHPGYTKNDIRRELVKCFEGTYSYILAINFDFVKKERNVLFVPVVPNCFKWGFEAIKTLVGQGKLCVRLNIDTVTVIKGNKNKNSASEDKSPSLSLEASSSSSLEASSSSSSLPLAPYRNQTIKLRQLKEMFPSRSEKDLLESLENHNSLNDAIFSLTEVKKGLCLRY